MSAIFCARNKHADTLILNLLWERRDAPSALSAHVDMFPEACKLDRYIWLDDLANEAVRDIRY
jgi:hypothetical protein